MKQHNKHYQNGATLIEALVATLLFLLGIVGMVSAMGMVVSNQADVQFRSEATRAAETMLSSIWLNVNRTSDTTIVESLEAFKHRTTSEERCNFTGQDSENLLVKSWLASLKSRGLPGTTDTTQQIDVNTAANNQVTITLCWKVSGDVAYRQYVLRSYVN